MLSPLPLCATSPPRHFITQSSPVSSRSAPNTLTLLFPGPVIVSSAGCSVGLADDPTTSEAPLKTHTCKAKNQARNHRDYGSVPSRSSPSKTLQRRRRQCRKKYRGLSTVLEKSNHSWASTLITDHDVLCHFILGLQPAHLSPPVGFTSKQHEYMG